MEKINLKADLVIIGDGIASLALAYLAAQRGIRTVILGKNFKGTTYSATGLIAPRPDYLLSDFELVGRTAFQCLRWLKIFPQVLKPQTFIIPIGPEFPYDVQTFRILLEKYDDTIRYRSCELGRHFMINQSRLEQMEPNLNKGIKGAIAIREWTVDPAILMEQLGQKALDCADKVKIIKINDFQEFKIRGDLVEEIHVIDDFGKNIRVFNDKGSLVVVNAAGPWIKDVCARLGVLINYQLRVGIQMEVPGWYFQSGIITFGSDGKYVICLQKKGLLQVGPTNSSFSGHPDNFSPSVKEIDYLTETLRNLLEDKKIPSYNFLKYGFRIKPTLIDTNRPVIWNHANSGLSNFYSLHPGKMSLALLAGDEMIDRIIADEWLTKQQVFMGNAMIKPIHLDGNRKVFNEIKLFLLKMMSLIKFGVFYIKFLISSK